MDQKKWRIIGAIVLLLGVITLLFSLQAEHRLIEEMYEKVMGHRPTSARWHLSIGIIMVIGGLIAVVVPWHKIKSTKTKR